MHPQQYTETRNASPSGTALDEDALLTSAQICARVGGVTTMCLWRWMRDDRVRFPLPLKINGRNYWRLGDLRQWQVAQSMKQVAD